MRQAIEIVLRAKNRSTFVGEHSYYPPHTMNEFTIRPATFSDRESIVGLNAESVAVTSPMDPGRFDYLIEHCAVCLAVEIDSFVAGFLMGMTGDSQYKNGNFAWFSQRLNRFIYVDRIVISQSARGLGLGSSLYSHLVSYAENGSLHSIAAEMDLDPPNVRSLEFHRAMGFVELGTRKLDSGKTVSMQVLTVGDGIACQTANDL